MKKGLLVTIITGLVLAVTLSIYTIVTVVNNNKSAVHTPVHYSYDIAYRTGDIVTELEGYTLDSEELTLEFEEGVTAQTQPIAYNEATEKFDVTNSGTVKAVIAAENGDTYTYNMTLYLQGDGKSVESPYILCNAAHLTEFAALASDKTAEEDYLSYNLSLVSDVDLGDVEWMPIGDNYRPFTGTINGNGHTISNMNINVNAGNYINFIAMKNPQLSISVGFFGKTVNAKITDLNFKDANILVASEVFAEITAETPTYKNVTGLAEGEINKICIGTVAGIMTRTTYTSTIENTALKIENTKIQGFSYNSKDSSAIAPEDAYITPSGIGGVVGVMSESEISNLDISGEIYANYNIAEGSRVGGVAGLVYTIDTNIGEEEIVVKVANKSSIDNVNVSANIFTKYYLKDAIGQQYDNRNYVGLIAAIVENTDILNVKVSNSTITDTNGKVSNTNGYEKEGRNAIVAGAVADASTVFAPSSAIAFDGSLEEYATTLTNVAVENLTIDIAANTAGMIGFVRENVKVVDSYVKNINAKSVVNSGFAYYVQKGGDVSYTENFNEEAAVSGELSGVRTAGFATYNAGNIAGFVNTTNNTTTYVDVNISGYGAYGSNGNVKEYSDDVHAAGLVAYMYSFTEGNTAKLSNFTVLANISKTVNYAGVVYSLGMDNDYHENYYNAEVENVTVRLTATSYSFDNVSTTHKVGGAVTNMYNNTKLSKVNVFVNFNQGVDKTQSYSAAIFGGLVAHVQGTIITIDTCGVNGNAYINEGNYYTMVETDGEGAPLAGAVEHFVQISGGLIGLMASEDYNSLALGNTVVITNNEVKDFTLIVDGEFANTTDSDNTDIFYQLRGIGALVGNVNTTLELADVLNLSTNKLSNVKVTANFEAFTFVKLKDNDVKELHILVGAGGNRAVGTLEELINSNTYENNLSFVTLPTRVEGDYTYTDSSKPAQSETPDAGEEAA